MLTLQFTKTYDKNVPFGPVRHEIKSNLITHGWMDNIKMWTGLSVEELIRMAEDRNKWRKYVRAVANSRIEDG